MGMLTTTIAWSKLLDVTGAEAMMHQLVHNNMPRGIVKINTAGMLLVGRLYQYTPVKVQKYMGTMS